MSTEDIVKIEPLEQEQQNGEGEAPAAIQDQEQQEAKEVARINWHSSGGPRIVCPYTYIHGSLGAVLAS